MNPRSETPKDEGPWGWQSREAVKKAGQLGPNHYAIYCALTHIQSAAPSIHKRRFAASYEEIASHVGCSERTVARCLVDLQKAELIHVFSGSNGGRRATRNAFFLASISYDSQADGYDCVADGYDSQSGLVNATQSYHVNATQSSFSKKKNKYKAGPQAPAVVLKKAEPQPTCSPLTGGSGQQKNPEIIHDFSHLPERDRAYMVAMRAIAAEADEAIAEQRRQAGAENFS
jgi:DNA-binding Lrp family transcriptional regulator